MLQLIIAGGMAVLKFFLGAGAIRFVTLSVLAAAVVGLVTLAVSLVPVWLTGGNIQTTASAIPPAAWFFLDYFKVPIGLGGIFGAYVARFLVRRIPIIG